MNAKYSRYLGLDIHRNYIMVGGVDADQRVVMAPRRIQLCRFDEWAAKELRPTDAVVLEATTNVWPCYDMVKPWAGEVVVAHVAQVKLIASAVVKTDKRDTLILAKLLAANLIPPVWVPPQPVRELRSLLNHRRHLVKQKTMAKNRLQGILFRHNLFPPDGGLFGQEQRTWWEQLPLNQVERFRAQQDLETLDALTGQCQQLDQVLAQLSVQEPWRAQMPFVLQMSGIGMVSALTILSAIGDIRRFDDPKKLVGYAGLGPRVHASGETHRGGAITKHGRRELRTILVEAAWVAVNHNRYWGEQDARLARHKGAQKAITIIARKMLVTLWHLLTKRQVDRHTPPTVIARAFLKWASDYRLATSLGMTRVAFVTQSLATLGLPTTLAPAVVAAKDRRPVRQ